MKSLLSIIKGFTPPYIISLADKIKRKLKLGTWNPDHPQSPENQDFLFDGDGEEFKQFIQRSKVYLEWGCGKSTIWANKNSACKIYTIDTSQEWLDHVIAKCTNRTNINLVHIDCGKLGDWGMPRNYEKRENFKRYTGYLSSFKEVKKPDLVLVDGRFRVCCFLNALLNCSPSTVIIFDDYLPRGQYHIVEEIAGKPWKTCGRQAIFKVPENIDIEKTLHLIDRFQFVFD